MIVLIGGEKGGTGKSTIATNLAVSLSSRGQDTVLIDADPQGTSSKWVARRDRHHNQLPKVHCIQKTGDIFETIKDLSNRYQHLIVDAGGRDSEELRSAMVASQKLYIPVKASQPDLETIERMSTIIRLAKSLNRDLEAYVFISMAPTHPSIFEAKEAQELLSSLSDFNLSKISIKERKVYRDAMTEGKSVVELGNDKATQEIINLYEEIYHGD